MNILEQIEKNIRNNPERTAVICENEKISYAELGKKASRLYRFLSENNIGNEDIVLFSLPRGADACIAILAVIKAGAAYVLLDEKDGDDKKKRIIGELKCKLTIDKTTFDRAMTLAPLEGCRGFTKHNLAFVTYTSGSTGKSKGVMHEYGSYERAAISCNVCGKHITEGRYIFSDFAPQSIISMHIFFSAVFTYGKTVAFPPFEYIFSAEKMRAFLEYSKADTVFFTPSLFRSLSPFPDTVKTVILASEPVSGDFCRHQEIISAYASTESGCFLFTDLCKKNEKENPVGRPSFDFKYALMAENGQKDKTYGELCYENPYMRGYTSGTKYRAEITDGLFRSGDIFCKGTNGRYYFAGRVNCSFKVHGDFVPEGRITKPFMKITGLSRAAAKCLLQNGKDTVVLFYFDEIKIAEKELKEKLKGELPDYLVPEKIIYVKNPAMLASGKIDRAKLTL